MILSIDFETASCADLKKTGAYVYSKALTTQVLCMAYRFDKGQVYSWRQGQPFPDVVLDHVANNGLVRAWNAAFELNIWNNVLRRHHLPVASGLRRSVPQLNISQVRDTMAAAAYWGLPLSLDQAGPAVGLGFSKDKIGHALMMRMCRPRSLNPLVWWHDTDPLKFDDLVAYCERDVLVESGVANLIPELPPAEQKTWELDQKINQRGVMIDRDLVLRLKDLALEASNRANGELDRLTGGIVKSINANAAMLAFLQGLGYPFQSLTKDKVEERLDEAPGGLEAEILRIRQDNAKTSAAKLNAMLACADDKDVVRGMLQYYGASRTGRWAGRLIQLQNLPRGSIKGTDTAIALIKAGASYEMIEALCGTMMDVVTSCLRGCIVARPGHKLVAIDASQIEARVVAWLSGQHDILDVFRNKGDVYKHTAAKVYQKPVDQIDPSERQLGKALVLGCGFGMGGPKFQATVAKVPYKVCMDEDDATKLVKDWRQANPFIQKFWWACDAAAKNCITSRTNQRVGHVMFGMMGQHMLIRLPNGRNLVYREAKMVPGSKGDQISYLGMNQYTRKWERIRTYGGKLVENITQATARDVLADVMHEAEDKTIPALLTVHDEIVCEVVDKADTADEALKTLQGIMAQPPAWAPGLPTSGDGWLGQRYKK